MLRASCVKIIKIFGRSPASYHNPKFPQAPTAFEHLAVSCLSNLRVCATSSANLRESGNSSRPADRAHLFCCRTVEGYLSSRDRVDIFHAFSTPVFKSSKKRVIKA
nr:hypothetical protein Iba_chr08dCG10510 [Ipomoea batatas]